jgi:predicted NBD/HSP70 family sugar kinase
VIVGGGIASMGEMLLAGIRQTVAERVGWFTRYAPVEIVGAELGDQAGAFGAAAWGRERAR